MKNYPLTTDNEPIVKHSAKARTNKPKSNNNAHSNKSNPLDGQCKVPMEITQHNNAVQFLLCIIALELFVLIFFAGFILNSIG